MQAHTKIYLDFFGYTTADWIGCEICNRTANDIHHIEARGMGGSKTKDVITNLMAVCRACHEMYGDREIHKDYLYTIHYRVLIAHLQKNFPETFGS